MLAQAFRDDPVHRWIYPSDAQWAWGSHRLFASLLRDLVAHRSGLTTPGREGAALWYAPGHLQPGLRARIELAAIVLWAVRARGPLVVRGLERLERRRPPDPHWYLSILGTHPDHQGRGVGSALLAPVLERCDREGVLAYLESSKAGNIPFYERHGFSVTGEVALPEGPKVWTMVRAPRGGSA